MLCPGPVFSNVLGESFTENPGQVNQPAFNNKYSQRRTVFIYFSFVFELLYIDA